MQNAFRLHSTSALLDAQVAIFYAISLRHLNYLLSLESLRAAVPDASHAYPYPFYVRRLLMIRVLDRFKTLAAVVALDFPIDAHVTYTHTRLRELIYHTL
jgi:hypothetical protein